MKNSNVISLSLKLSNWCHLSIRRFFRELLASHSRLLLRPDQRSILKLEGMGDVSLISNWQIRRSISTKYLSAKPPNPATPNHSTVGLPKDFFSAEISVLRLVRWSQQNLEMKLNKFLLTCLSRGTGLWMPWTWMIIRSRTVKGRILTLALTRVVLVTLTVTVIQYW